MDCAGPRQKNLLQLISGGASSQNQQVSAIAPMHGTLSDTPGGKTKMQLSTLDAEINEIKQDLQRNLHPQVEALRFTMGNMQAEVEHLVAEVKKPPELPMQLFQQFNDRLTLQEQKQKEQEDLIKELLENRQTSPEAGGGQTSRRREKSTVADIDEEELLALLARLQAKNQVGPIAQPMQEELLPARTRLGSDGTSASANNMPASAPATRAHPKPVRTSTEELQAPQTPKKASPRRSERKTKKDPVAVARDSDVEVLWEGDLDLDMDGARGAVSTGLGMSSRQIDADIGTRSARTQATQLDEDGNDRRKKRTVPTVVTTAGNPKMLYDSGKSPGSPVRKVQVTEPLQQVDERPWNESIWEVALLVFMNGLGKGASIHVLVLLVANIMVQGSFAAVAFYNFNDEIFSDENLDDSRSFRLSIGHNVRFQDTVSKKSLMRRVCDGGFILDMGTKPGTLVEDITSYLALDADPGLERFFAGELMCVLAIACWAMVFVAEFDRAFTFCWALLSVPLRAQSGFLLSPEEDTLEFDGISIKRVGGAALLILIRLAISVTLLIVGFFWLIYTVDVETLLLNAVALGFVLEVDSMLFVIAPSQVKALVGKLQPLPVRPLWSWRGIDVVSILSTVFVLIVAFVMYVAYIAPQTDKMMEISDILCKGTLDFVYTQDSVGMTYVSPAFPFEDTHPQVIIARESVREVVDYPHNLDDKPLAEWISTPFVTPLVPDIFLEAAYPAAVVGGFSVSQLVDMYNPLCNDDVWDAVPQLKINFAAISPLGFAPNDINCQGLANWFSVSTPDGIFLRMACPNLAGCTSPRSAVPSLFPTWGCPTACATDVEVVLLGLPCQDVPAETLLNSSYWRTWAEHIGMMANRVSNNGAAIVDHLVTQGCDGLATIESVSLPVFSLLGLCSGEEFNVHPLAHACPVSCRCATALTRISLAVCPQSCLTQVLT